jgi:ATP-dependent Clp protease ATP-binding subunit ClpC
VVRRIDRRHGRRGARGRRPRFSRAARTTLELSLREALDLGHTYIGTEHLLLGLARGDDRVVADTLGAFGLDLRTLRRGVVEALAQAG